MSKTEESRKTGRTIRVGALADLHLSKSSQGQVQTLLQQVSPLVDILLLGGDLTDHGLPEEAHILARELSGVRVPVVGVLGNHDYESGHEIEVLDILNDAGVKILQGDACEVLGIGIAGVKGFAGGFGRGMLGSWGEGAIKNFVKAAVDEALHLEAALVRLRTPQKIALLHYSPIEATVEGEPREIFPFLGCGRLAEPLTRYTVSVVVHGHAHRGSPEGKIGEVPVYNVSLPLLRKMWPDKPPVRIIEMKMNDTLPDSGNGT